MEIKLTSNIDAVDKALKELGYYSPQIAKKITRTLAAKVKSRIKRMVYRYFKRHTGEIKNDIRSKTYMSGNSVVYLSGGKANALELGAKILPKNGEYLTFQIGNRWIKSKMIELKPKDYFYPSGDSFINSSDFQMTMNNILSKEVDRLWRKNQ